MLNCEQKVLILSSAANSLVLHHFQDYTGNVFLDSEECGCRRDINDKVHKEFLMEEEYHGTWDFREQTELENTGEMLTI